VRLSPGQSFTVEVNFAPKNMGRKSGQLTILSAEGGSPVLIPLTATAAASSRRAVKLNWEESPVTVAGYVVYRSADSSGPYTRISQATTPEFVDTGLSAGHTYYYVVTSLDADQVESEYSTPITATVPEG
jgi:fibronectin type 3 domain-containing protein